MKPKNKKILWVFLLLFSRFVLGLPSRLEEIEKKYPSQFDKLIKAVGTNGLEALLEERDKVFGIGDSAFLCNGRLTLTTALPVTTANVTGASAVTVYFTPYEGNKIALYSGTTWQTIDFTQKSVAVPSHTTKPFDIFAYNNSGTLALETVDWANDSARVTALTSQDGVAVKNGAATRRYLGTGRTTTTSGQTEDSTSRRFLWNKYNRVQRRLYAANATSSWSYSVASFRAANSDTTAGSARVEYMLGQQLDPVELRVLVPQLHNASGPLVTSVGIGIDSVTTNSADLYGGISNSDYMGNIEATYVATQATGYHYAQWLEWTTATGTTIFYANGANKSALIGFVWG